VTPGPGRAPQGPGADHPTPAPARQVDALGVGDRSSALPAGYLDQAPRRVHLVGVGGAGMSGLARLLLARGHAVTGSDQRESATLAALRELGADVWAGHDGSRLARPDLVVVSSAIRAGNPELVAAGALGVPVMRRGRMLAMLMAGRTGLVVAGTHGKTTTTGMATMILQEAGFDPSFAVGGDFKSTGSNAQVGTGQVFVAEADESDGSFLELSPAVAVVTNVEADHLDHWGTLEAIRAGFRRFVGLLPPDGTAVLCADDPGALALAGDASCPVVTYGLGPGPEVRATDVEAGGAGSRFAVTAAGRRLGEVRLVMPGHHMVANALAAIAATRALGVPFPAAQAALAGYTGAARRFHLRHQLGGVTVVDDYAHHPTEVAATLAAARLGRWARVVAVFQPHLYSRTRAFAPELGQALSAADVVLVTDVYAAREDPQPGVDGALVVAQALRARPNLDCAYVPERKELAKHVAAVLRPGDLLLTLGAGDITTLADEVAELLPPGPDPAAGRTSAPGHTGEPA
jgi:UDP-N-acetylmuramate--alanine ligase